MKITTTILTTAVLLGTMVPAFAHDFVVDQDMHNKYNNFVAKQENYRPVSGYVPGRFSGSSAYNNGLAGQLAVQTDRIGDHDGKAFTVHPVRGGEFNATLRYGDTGQSRETRFNQAFNN